MYNFFLGVLLGMGIGVIPHYMTMRELCELRESLKFKEREKHDALDKPYAPDELYYG